MNRMWFTYDAKQLTDIIDIISIAEWEVCDIGRRENSWYTPILSRGSDKVIISSKA